LVHSSIFRVFTRSGKLFVYGYDYVYDLVFKVRNFVNVNLNVNGERVLEGRVLLRYDHQLVP